MLPFCTIWSLCITYEFSSRHIKHSNPSWEGWGDGMGPGPWREWGLCSHLWGRVYFPSKQEGAESDNNNTQSVQTQGIQSIQNSLDSSSAYGFSSRNMSACVYSCKRGHCREVDPLACPQEDQSGVQSQTLTPQPPPSSFRRSFLLQSQPSWAETEHGHPEKWAEMRAETEMQSAVGQREGWCNFRTETVKKGMWSFYNIKE